VSADFSISLMLAVPDAAAATAWYKEALGARELWNLGSVVGLEVRGAPIFLAEPEAANGWNSPEQLGSTSVRVEVFLDGPDAFVEQAVRAGADVRDPVLDHHMPWGVHRQGVFTDPFGHLWFVGDRSPLEAHGEASGDAAA
jgi:uncharacterized glyoxalase superfamily protein PhnB